MLDEVLSRLDLVRRAPHGYMARCPAHSDRSPSLSVREIHDLVRLHCFAGCLEEDIWRAIGMERPGFPAPMTVFQRALMFGRSQQARRVAAGPADELRRLIVDLRADATRLGDTEEAWELLDEASAHERIVWAMTP